MRIGAAVVGGIIGILAIVSLVVIVNAIHVKNLTKDLEMLRGESGRMVLQASEMVFENKIKELRMAKEQKETFTDRGVLLTIPTKEGIEKIDKEIAYYQRRLELLKKLPLSNIETE